MNFKQLLLGVLLMTSVATFAQKNTKEVLFTIDQKPYYTDEFKRVYNKNLDLVKDESQKDLNQYLELYIGYKLKISKAYELGLQNGTAYINELKSYRNQLSKNYLTDTKVTKELVDEAYKRSLKEIKASHILVLVDENASPADTLAAYKKISTIRDRAVKGENFGELAFSSSEDPSAKENKGELGYFSTFRMVYPFESAAYTTKKGEISKIVRTRFGYHILNVEDIRDNRGELSAAHIMITVDKSASEEEQAKAKNTIDDIYKKLQQGEDFATLAKQFSQDKSSAPKGGVLNKFGSGQLSSDEFEDAAFKLSKENPLSVPIQSQFGWHIIKFIEKHPVKSLEEMTKDLETKIERDDRSKKIITSMNEKLTAKYAPKRNEKLFTAVKKAVNDKFYTAEWVMPENTTAYEGALITFNTKTISGKEFLQFVSTHQKRADNVKPISAQVDKLYKEFLNTQLNQTYNDNLENEFPDFAAIMDEYRDGLLLFDLMEKEIWEKSKTDTIGLTQFYEKNIQKYQWKDRYDVVIISSTKEDIAKKALKLLNKKEAAATIKSKLNTKDVVNVMIAEGVFEEGNDALPKSMASKVGLSKVFKEGDYYYVVKINKIIPAASKTLEEAKGRVVNDYQHYLEENWVSDLKKQFQVEVDRAVFEKVKKELTK
jgi:peptidyl-prolyl cis-trans isomerase SurA